MSESPARSPKRMLIARAYAQRGERGFKALKVPVRSERACERKNQSVRVRRDSCTFAQQSDDAAERSCDSGAAPAGRRTRPNVIERSLPQAGRPAGQRLPGDRGDAEEAMPAISGGRAPPKKDDKRRQHELGIKRTLLPQCSNRAKWASLHASTHGHWSQAATWKRVEQAASVNQRRSWAGAPQHRESRVRGAHAHAARSQSRYPGFNVRRLPGDYTPHTFTPESEGETGKEDPKLCPAESLTQARRRRAPAFTQLARGRVVVVHPSAVRDARAGGGLGRRQRPWHPGRDRQGRKKRRRKGVRNRCLTGRSRCPFGNRAREEKLASGKRGAPRPRDPGDTRARITIPLASYRRDPPAASPASLVMTMTGAAAAAAAGGRKDGRANPDRDDHGRVQVSPVRASLRRP